MRWPSDISPDKRQMLDEQLAGRGIRSPRVLFAMSQIPREQFVSEAVRESAYADRALPIDCDQTISQPYIVALMTEALELSGGERVLEIGTGTGYQTAVLAELAGSVTTVERHPELSRLAGERLQALGYENVTLVVADGSLGWIKNAPYDRILVAAAAPKYSKALFEQLADGGVMVAPIGPSESQSLEQIRKVAGRPTVRNLGGCRFVPLVGEAGETK
jgi:protein-L-isoaspartate(D-aspartate) O-methyltransferase